MPSKKVSELPVVTNAELASGDLVPIVDLSAGLTKKISIAELDLRYKAAFDAVYSQLTQAISLTFGMNILQHNSVGNINAPAGTSFVVCDATIGAQSVTLPSASANPGAQVTVVKKDVSANAVTIVGTVSGEVDPILGTQWETRTAVAVGGIWIWRI